MKHSIKDFENGDEVYHLSNSRRKMVVIGLNEESNEVTCRWVDDTGNSIKQEFYSTELGKCSTIDMGIAVRTFSRSNRNSY